MLAASRIFAVVVFVMILTGCDRITEAKLFGTWRAEDDETVNEIACRRDHSFTSWTSWKNELTTPSVAIGAGDWHIQDRELVVHFTKYVTVDTWAEEDKQIKFAIVKIRNDALLMKNFDGSKVLTYKRLLLDYVLAPIKRAPNDVDFVGTWQIHYNTHDYEMTFNQDHTCGDFAELDGVRTQCFAGAWRIKDSDLIMDAKSIPTFNGESITSGHQRWAVIGVEPQRIAIRDGPVQYLLQRLK